MVLKILYNIVEISRKGLEKMKKRLFALFLIVCMVSTLVGCNKKDTTSSSASSVESEVVTELSKYVVNPLTGTEDLKRKSEKDRPTAIMINNIETAWGVQASLSKADIVYETYVEGGITRLLAVFKDISKVGEDKIGSLRSGRYSYVDLALGHDARFVHAGLDNVYCKPHIKELGATTVDLNSSSNSGKIVGGNSCAARISNGLSLEHTLYTTGNDISKFLKDNADMKLKSAQENWQNFVAEGSEYVPADGECNKLFVPFSSSYTAEFEFNNKTKKYDKYRQGEKQTDYANGKAISFNNVLVLYSEVNYFSDNKHVKTELGSGEGYYVSNGGYRKIKWSKGDAYDSIKLTDKDGKEIDYNPGTTYVCFTNSNNKDNTTFQ